MLFVQYAKFVKPAFENFILPTKKYADIIMPRGGDNHVAVDLIVQHIHTKLGQHELCKIYSNLYVIHSTFQVFSINLLFICWNLVASPGYHYWAFSFFFFSFLSLFISWIVPAKHFQIRGMHTLIRDAKTTKHDFIFYADRLIRLVRAFLLYFKGN